MAVEDSVAQSQIRAFVERVERLDEELRAINDDKKEIYAEAKGNGFDVAALKQVIKLRRQDANERMEREAIVELYMAALGMIETPDFDEPRVHVQAHVREAASQSAPETIEITEPQPTKAAGQAVTAQEPVATSPVESDAAEISTPITENQSPQPAARDLTSPSQAPGQVAPFQESPRKAAEAEGESPALQGEATIASTEAGHAVTAEPATSGRTATENVIGVKAGVTSQGGENPASKPMYAAPGVVVMEHTPPEGAIAHPYATVWPVRDADPAGGIREPIVKIGKLILDGRGRMFAARGVDGGKGIEYPVVQYDGSDALLDSIRWNMASRPGLHPHNLNMIATKLVKLEPARADDIRQAMGLEQTEAAE